MSAYATTHGILPMSLLQRLLVLTGLVLFLSTAALAEETAFIEPIEYEIIELENGLTLIVHEDHSVPVVSINTWFDIGSNYDPPQRSGFGHLFEHLFSQETENLEAGDFRQLVEAAGGNRNATINFDRTAYFENLPANRINLAMWLGAERLGGLRIQQDNFDREREVVKEERRQRVDNQPYGIARLEIGTLSTDWEPYKRPVIGSMEDLDAATLDDVVEFHERYYGPNNATMVVAGAVSVDQVRELADKYLADIPRGRDIEDLPPMPEVPRDDGERRKTIEDPLANLPAVVRSYTVPPQSHDDYHALDLLSNIFSVGESSRLYERLVRTEGAALAAVSHLDSRVGPGNLQVLALPNHGVEIERIEALIDEEVTRLIEEGVTERELEKARNHARANMIFNRQTVSGRAWALQSYRLYHGDIDAINTDLDRYMEVTVDDLRRVAATYLVPDNRAVITVVPADDAN